MGKQDGKHTKTDAAIARVILDAYQERGGAELTAETIELLTNVIRVLGKPVAYTVRAWGWCEDRVREIKLALGSGAVDPPLQLLGAVAEAMKYLDEDEHPIAEMFEQLLRTACSPDPGLRAHAHPAFADIIRQLSGDEALLVWGLLNKEGWFERRYREPKDSWRQRQTWKAAAGVYVGKGPPPGALPDFAKGLGQPEMLPVYVDHLVSLHVLEIRLGRHFGVGAQNEIAPFSPFGRLFAEACTPKGGFSWSPQNRTQDSETAEDALPADERSAD